MSSNLQVLPQLADVHDYNAKAATVSNLVLYGVNYRSATIDFRESLAFSKDRQQIIIEDLMSLPGVEEAVVMNTCNRVEFLCTTYDRNHSTIDSLIKKIFHKYSGVNSTELTKHLYCYHDVAVVHHLFRVASGLDSMVLGEPQILGQLKQAYRLAQFNGATKSLVNRLFSRAFGVAKLVRSQTKIGQLAVSLCFATRQLAQQIFGDLSEAKVMVLGSGEMGALILKHFVAAGVKQCFIVSNAYAHGLELAEETGAVPLTYTGLNNFLPEVDIVVGASLRESSELPIVDRTIVEAALNVRLGRPQFYADLAIPRNFCPEISKLEDIFLYNLDDMQNIVRQNIEGRELEVQRAEALIAEEVNRFNTWCEKRALDGKISRLFENCAKFKSIETTKTLRRLRKEGLTEEEVSQLKAALDDLADGLIAKLLHQPLTVFKSEALSNPRLVENFKRLFL